MVHSRPAIERRVQLPAQWPLCLRPDGRLDRSAVAPRVAHGQLLGSDARILTDRKQEGTNQKDTRQQAERTCICTSEWA